MAKRLGEILLSAGVLDAKQLQAGLARHQKDGRPLGITLVRLGYLDETTLIQTLSKQLATPMARLTGKAVNTEVLEVVPPDLAEKHRCLPLFLKSEGGAKALYLGMEDASDRDAIDAIERHSGLSVRPVLVAPSELDEALPRLYARLREDGDLGGGEVDWGDSDPSDDSISLALEDLRAALPKESGPDAELPLDYGAEPEEGEPPLEFDDNPGEPDLEVDLEADLPVLAAPRGRPAGPARAPIPQAAGTPVLDTPVDAGSILRALTQLLVEKGILTREELVERLGTLADED